ncbi:MAG TPA: extracellular solute-binding protein [Actinoplanes sp.]|nr:extracellular solute-binding protein [Actinoplanes sp.]
MELSRRRLLQASLLAAAGGITAACGGGSGSKSSDSKEIALWYWSGGLSDKVVADAVTQFAQQTTIKPSVVGGDFKQKLTTTLAAGRSVPDITGIKGEDIAALLPQAKQFVDLNTLGADKLAAQFLPWKWKQGSTQDGKLIGFPIDIGPTALFYREDLFAKAGLPSKPEDVSAALSTWDAYFAAGVKLKAALPKSFLVSTVSSIFGVAVGQNTVRFIDSSNKFVGDQDHIRKAWDTALKPFSLGIDAKINDNSWNAAVGNGTVAAEVGAAWHALDISQAAPDTKGKWRVAAGPGGPANIGGSFLAIPKAAGNPDLAFQVITWLLSPENEARGFTDAALFPSSPAAYKLPALTAPDPFFGNQVTIDVFGPAAQKIPIAYEAPGDAAVAVPYYNELLKVEGGKDAAQGWTDAVSQAKQIAQKQGVS